MVKRKEKQELFSLIEQFQFFKVYVHHWLELHSLLQVQFLLFILKTGHVSFIKFLSRSL